MDQILAVFYKELKSEFKNRYSISNVLLFVLTTVTILAFATATSVLTAETTAGLLWVVMFFSAMTGLSRSFIQEEERGTEMMLKLMANSSSIYFGKLLYNILLAIFLDVTVVMLFFIFVAKIPLKEPLVFVFIIIFGGIGKAAALTIISALISKANSKNALLPVLALPVLLPLLVIGIDITRWCFEPDIMTNSLKSISMLFAYCGIIGTMSYYLFDFVWHD